MSIMISADPATGGSVSLPAFAVWDINAYDNTPTLVDCGTVRPVGKTHWQRMRSLSFVLPAALIKAFDGHTELLSQLHLVIEGLPPTMSGLGSKYGAGGFSNNNAIHLHHSVSVIATCLDWLDVQELQVITWKSWLKAMCLFDQYEKGDRNDAVIIGLAYLCVTRHPMPHLPQAVMRQLFPKTSISTMDKKMWDDWGVHMQKSRERTKRDKAVKAAKKLKTK